MSIEVSAVGYLTRFVGERKVWPAESWIDRPVGEFLALLGIPASVAYIIMVNGQRQGASYLLQDGDRVRLLPLVTGG